MSDFIDTDVLIIGGGPAGCACALYTARSALSTIILDKNPAVGALAITHKIANYPGVDANTSGADLLKTMREQAVSYGADYRQAQVYGIDATGDLKVVYTPEGTFRGKTLVLATGAMGRTSTLPGEDTFLGRGVSYCATCDAAFFKNQDVAVYGENQESIDEAMVLTKFAKTVHWVTKRSPNKNLKGASHLEKLDNVNVWKRGKITTILGDDSGVTEIEIKQNSEQLKIPVQGGLDPKILLTDKETLKKEATRYLEIFKDHPYVFNLGHGVLPETKPEMVEWLVNTVKDFK